MNKISEHIALWEVECPCGCKVVENNPNIINKLLVQGFEKIRNYVKRPVHINSGYRCSYYQIIMRNKEIESKKLLYGMTEEELFIKRLIWHSLDSFHCYGNAFDIRVNELDNLTLFAISIYMGFTGIGLYPWGCHIDIRKTFTTWNRK